MRDPFAAGLAPGLAASPVEVGAHEEEHAADDARDQDVVADAGPVDERVAVAGRHVVAEPGVGEAGGGVGVALAAGAEQVLLHLQALPRVRLARDVVDAVTVVADGLVRQLLGVPALEERDRRAVEVGHVGAQDLGRELVLRHPLVVGVAVGADPRRLQAEPGGSGVVDVVDAVAVDAGRHVRVAGDERGPVDALADTARRSGRGSGRRSAGWRCARPAAACRPRR